MRRTTSSSTASMRPIGTRKINMTSPTAVFPCTSMPVSLSSQMAIPTAHASHAAMSRIATPVNSRSRTRFHMCRIVCRGPAPRIRTSRQRAHGAPHRPAQRRRKTCIVGQPSRRVVVLSIAAFLILGCALTVALSDAGLPLPAGVVLVALSICLLAIGAAGIVGYRRSRGEGRGFWRSIGTGLRTAGRTLVDLF